MHHLAVFGGTFDPIHNGHLQTSLTIQAHFKFDTYLFLPCKTPLTKPPTLANKKQKIEMIQRAIEQHQHFKLDLREMKRPTPSYMVNTLKSFRKQYPNQSITLIMGYDAFLSLPHWYQWEKIMTLAHLLVINRFEFAAQPISESMQTFLKKYQNNKEQEMLTTRSGSIFLFDAGHYEISSSSLRDQIKKGAEVHDKLPHTVYEYIKEQGLYQ